MKFFVLNRIIDSTGISGEGIVAEGCEFDDGTCVIKWRGNVRSLVIHKSIDDVRNIHCHNNNTLVEYVIH